TRKSTALLVMAVLFACKNEVKDVQKVSSDGQMPVMELFNTEITYTEDGKLHSKLISEHIQRFRGDSAWTLMPNGLRSLVYDSLGNVESEINAQYGIWLEDNRLMIAEKDVQVENNAGEKLNTEKLIWYQDSGIFYTDQFVKITQPSGVIYGKGLRAREDFKDYEILNISGNIAVEE
ncbi:MAG: LPS export ABC transporter periplasmic protein LptC, partial [Luteibaculum sp.]